LNYFFNNRFLYDIFRRKEKTLTGAINSNTLFLKSSSVEDNVSNVHNAAKSFTAI
jgi:hypothetical protein